MHDQVHLRTARPVRAVGFNRPMDVVEATGIPAREKHNIPNTWEVDELALQRAEDEGMGGGEPAHLQRIQEALSRLEGLGANS